MKIYKNKKSYLVLRALLGTIAIFISGSINAGSEYELIRKTLNMAKKLLIMNVSPNLNNSHSRALSRHFSEQLNHRYPGQYTQLYRDLEREPIPYIHANSLEVITAGTAKTPEARTLQILSDTLIEEVANADAIVIATPMHNFTVPAPLKAYFDIVLRAGKTFKYTSKGPEGMLADRPVMLITSSGGCYHGTPRDFLTPYVRCVLSFMGIENCISVAAEGLAMSDKRDIALVTAKEALERRLEFFHPSCREKA